MQIKGSFFIFGVVEVKREKILSNQFKKILAMITMVTTFVAIGGVNIFKHYCSRMDNTEIVNKMDCPCESTSDTKMSCCMYENSGVEETADCCEVNTQNDAAVNTPQSNMETQGLPTIQNENCCVDYRAHSSVNESFIASSFSNFIVSINFTGYISNAVENSDIYCKVKTEIKKFENLIALPRMAIIKFIQYISHINKKDDSNSNA